MWNGCMMNAIFIHEENSYDFSSEKCDYGKVNPVRVDCDT